MSSARDQAKLFIGALEPLQRQLMAADDAWAEIDKVAGILSVRKDELRETEVLLQRTKVAVQEATSALDQLRATSAKEEARIRARTDCLEAEMVGLENQVVEKRGELDQLRAGIATLYQRLAGSNVVMGGSG